MGFWRYKVKEIKAFIFDMDGVITETSENHYLAWKDLGEKLGISVSRELNEQLKGISRMASLEVILNSVGKSGDYTDEEKLSMTDDKNAIYVEMIKAFTPDNLLDGIKELFASLKEKGIKIGVASASRNAAMLIDLLGIRDDVDYIVDPTTVRGKPEPDIFLAAAKALGVEPKDCIGVEDAYSGVEAINSAGMYAVGIGSPDILDNADIVYGEPKDIDLDFLLNLK